MRVAGVEQALSGRVIDLLAGSSFELGDELVLAAVARQDTDPVGEATTMVRSSAANLNQSNLNVAVSSDWQSGDDVTVTATYPYSISLLGWVVSSGNLSSKTTERVE